MAHGQAPPVCKTSLGGLRCRAEGTRNMLLPAVGLCTSCGIQSFRRVACISLCARWLDRGRLHGVLCFIQYGFGFAVFHERFPHQRRGNDRHDRDDRRDPLGGKEVAIESRPREWNYDIGPGQGRRQRYLMYRRPRKSPELRRPTVPRSLRFSCCL